MALPDPTLFSDAADALGISRPAIVEKDYYAVLLLELLATIDFCHHSMIFAGGTCLAKAHRNTYRMSEDIDMKLVPLQGATQSSRTGQRKLRADCYQQVIEALERSEYFNLSSLPQKKNEGRFQQFLIEYPRFYADFNPLRPYLQLEITESHLHAEAVLRPIRSLYAEVAELPHEIDQYLCVDIHSIAAEKFVSLLRRTALTERDPSRVDDDALIRHAYDLHLIVGNEADLGATAALIPAVIECDVQQFGNRHTEFQQNPTLELAFGFRQLRENSVHEERYRRFIGPLVYHSEPAEWRTALATLERLATKALKCSLISFI